VTNAHTIISRGEAVKRVACWGSAECGSSRAAGRVSSSSGKKDLAAGWIQGWSDLPVDVRGGRHQLKQTEHQKLKFRKIPEVGGRRTQ